MENRQLLYKIVIDTGPVDALVNELKDRYDSCPVVIDNFLGGINGAEDLTVVHQELHPAAGTGELVATLYPSDQFTEFMSALRTGKLDGAAVIPVDR